MGNWNRRRWIPRKKYKQEDLPPSQPYQYNQSPYHGTHLSFFFSLFRYWFMLFVDYQLFFCNDYCRWCFFDQEFGEFCWVFFCLINFFHLGLRLCVDCIGSIKEQDLHFVWMVITHCMYCFISFKKLFVFDC